MVNLKPISDTLLRAVTKEKVKELRKKRVDATVDRVMQDIDGKNLATVLSFGYTVEEIKGMVEDMIGKS